MSKAETGASTPSRTLEQRRQSLALANEVRTARSRLKEQLKQGVVSLDSLFEDYPSCLATAKVTELVRALPGYGQVRADKLLTECRISPAKTVAGLTPRQRQTLRETLSR